MPAWSSSTTPLSKENRLVYVFEALQHICMTTTEHTTFQVGGGVLSTASYEARKYGVRSGMAGESRSVSLTDFPKNFT